MFGVMLNTSRFTTQGGGDSGGLSGYDGSPHLSLNGTFDFDTRISNLGTPDQVTSVYHQPDTGPWTQTFYASGEVGENKHINPKWQLGMVPFGGIGEPMIALFYSDDGDDRDGMLARGEITQERYDAKPGNTFVPTNRFGQESKITWITEPGGTFAVVRDRAGSCYEAFTWDDHTSGAKGGPSLRIGTSQGGGSRGAYLEFGRGLSADCDFRIARGSGDYISWRINNNNDKISMHNSLTWRRGITLNDGMALYFVNDGEEVIETFTASADFEQSYTVAQSLADGYQVKDVQVNGDGVHSAGYTVEGQVVTIDSHIYDDNVSGLEGGNLGHSIKAGDKIRIRMTYPRGNALRLKADYDASRGSILNLGGVLKVNDIINGAGDSAFTSGGGGGLFTDAGNVSSLASQTTASVFRASGAGDLPVGAGNYGTGFTVKSEAGNSGLQVYTDYTDGDFFWRTGLPGSSGFSSTWYKAASTDYVDTAVAGVSGGGSLGYVDVGQNTAQNFVADTYTPVEFQVVNRDTVNGWDAANHWYACPASGYATITLSMKASGSVGSGQTMVLEIQESSNGGANWVNICQTANVDFYGNCSLSGVVEVSAGKLLRGRARFNGNNRTSAGNGSVRMTINITS